MEYLLIKVTYLFFNIHKCNVIIINCIEKFSTGDGKGKKGIDTTMIIGGVIGIY